MPDAGVLRQDYVQGGQTTVGFTPFPGAAEQIEVLSDQLEQELQHYRAEIARLVQPWSDRWAEAQGWGAKIALLQEARDRGMERGAHAWAHDNVSFLQEVGGYMADIGHYVVDQGEQLVDWYSDLPMLEKVFPTYAAGNALAHQASDAIDEAGEEVQKLWAQRQALLDFFKAIHDQSVNAVQIAIETLSKMGGELGQLMKALWDHGAAWVQGLIEVCRQTDALQKVFASVGAIFTAIPMNLWAEGIGTAGGYIIPELLVSALLAILAALTDGGLAPILAARLLAYGDKIKDIFTKLGRLGPVLTRLYEGIKELGGKITELTRVVWRHIEEKTAGTLNKENKILRSLTDDSDKVSTRASRRTGGLSAKEANKPHTDVGNRPPYESGTRARDIILKRDRTFSRVHGENNKARSWMMRNHEIKGLSASEIQEKFALPEAPSFISDVEAPSGTLIRTGTVAPQDGWGSGGAIQYELQQRLPESAFMNTRPIK